MARTGLALLAALAILACSLAATEAAGRSTPRACKRVSITNEEIGSMYNGIPLFTATITNDCECSISNIHLRCGWFASAKLVNPKSFRRLSFDNCLVNGGKPMNYTDSVTFRYANSFIYPLKFKSANFTDC